MQNNRLYPNCSEYTEHLKLKDEEISIMKNLLDIMLDNIEGIQNEKIDHIMKHFTSEAPEYQTPEQAIMGSFIEEDIIDLYIAAREIFKLRRKNDISKL